MRKLSLVLALAIAINAIGMATGCSGNNSGSSVERVTTVATTAAPVAKFDTMGITPEELVECYNSDPVYGVNYSTNYTTTDNGDGSSSFAITEIICGLTITGKIDNATQEIFELSCFFSTDESLDSSIGKTMYSAGSSSDDIYATESNVKKILSWMFFSDLLRYIMGLSADSMGFASPEGNELVMEAYGSAPSSKTYGNYEITVSDAYVGDYDGFMFVTMITNEE